jgi:hypothetical protein
MKVLEKREFEAARSGTTRTTGADLRFSRSRGGGVPLIASNVNPFLNPFSCSPAKQIVKQTSAPGGPCDLNYNMCGKYVLE